MKSKQSFSGQFSNNILMLKFIDRDLLSVLKLQRQLRYLADTQFRYLAEFCRNEVPVLLLAFESPPGFYVLDSLLWKFSSLPHFCCLFPRTEMVNENPPGMKVDVLMGRRMVVLREFPRKHLCLEPQLGRSTGCGRGQGMHKKANCREEEQVYGDQRNQENLCNSRPHIQRMLSYHLRCNVYVVVQCVVIISNEVMGVMRTWPSLEEACFFPLSL